MSKPTTTQTNDKPTTTTQTSGGSTDKPKSDGSKKFQFQADARMVANLEQLKKKGAKVGAFSVELTDAQIIRSIFLRGYELACKEAGINVTS